MQLYNIELKDNNGVILSEKNVDLNKVSELLYAHSKGYKEVYPSYVLSDVKEHGGAGAWLGSIGFGYIIKSV